MLLLKNIDVCGDLVVSSFVAITIRERGMGGGDCIECNSCRKHAEEKQQWKILVVSRHFVSHLFISSFCPKFWPMTLRDVLDWIGLATYQLINLRPMFVFWNPSGFGQVPFHLGFSLLGVKKLWSLFGAIFLSTYDTQWAARISF